LWPRRRRSKRGSGYVETRIIFAKAAHNKIAVCHRLGHKSGMSATDGLVNLIPGFTGSPPASVGVLIPTRNSMPLLPRHFAAAQSWLDLAQEIVVMDSDSRDGTVEFLREKLPKKKTRFLSHPPGLYQSWNFGMRQISAQYTYISTIGDEISRDGLEHLIGVAERFSCDAVISPPEFVDRRGQRVGGNRWPVHKIISYLNLESPMCVEGLLPFAMALSFLPFALLGSSASNIYRTSMLQENPFPTGFGLNGDGAWGIIHAAKIKLGITPKRAGTFLRKHPKSYRRSEYISENPDRRMLEAGLQSLRETLDAQPELKAEAAQLGLDEFVRQKLIVQRWREELIYHRRIAGWCFKPTAWHARIRRIIAQHRCEEMLKNILTSSANARVAPKLAVAAP
jgi:hypothetical protein